MRSPLRTGRLPPPGLAEWNDDWSRLVRATDSAGVERTWHVLDTGREPSTGTLLCVHGNPTWSYHWRRLADAAPAWRVVAPDHLDMGWSDRTGELLRLSDRIADLGAVVDALELDGPVVTVAHDWGGPISLGWALEHRDDLAGVVLMNTGVARPDGVSVPSLIRLARNRATWNFGCVRTPLFVRGTLRLARPQLDAAVHAGYLAPYRRAELRSGIGDFVADIPIEPDHPTAEPLAHIAERIGELAGIPTLLLWGAKDPVFSDAFLADLVERLPHADVHRYPDAGHLVMEDARAERTIVQWLSERRSPADARPRTAGSTHRPLWAALERRRNDHATAIVEMGSDGSPARTVAFDELWCLIETATANLHRNGLRPGDKIAPLVEPGADLVALVFAGWRLGATVVVADGALGPRGIVRSLRAVRPDVVIGDRRGRSLAKALRLAPQRLDAATLLEDSGAPLPPAAPPEGAAVVVFTSGSTGPSKPVVYHHHQLEAQRDVLVTTYRLDEDDRLVAAFAPFAIFGPIVGIASAVPDMNVSKPGSLTAAALAAAARSVDATVAFFSPAALRNVDATAEPDDPQQSETFGRIRAVASAGAPVPAELLRAVAAGFPNATVHTPYGMTEAMPVTDVDLATIDSAGPGHGVCVGMPVDGVAVRIDPLDEGDADVHRPDVTGEILVQAEHASAGYHQLWATQRRAWRDGWHHTGDVGHLDDAGRLWVEGRLAHVIHAADGPITPVAVEHAAETVAEVRQAAAVGVGPTGTQQLVVVASTDPKLPGPLAPLDLVDAVRRAVDARVAAVLIVDEIPVDRRHNSKIDRDRLRRWAEKVLAGRRAGAP